MVETEWQTIDYKGESISAEVLARSNHKSLVVGILSDSPNNVIVYTDDGEQVYSKELGAPNSGDISEDGLFVFADWRVYGKRTDSDIILVDPSNGEHREFTVNHSAPLVAITRDGSKVILSSYDGYVRIYDADDFSLLSKHAILFGERLIPDTHETKPNQIRLHHHNEKSELQYTIDYSGNVHSMTNEVEEIRYIESFNLDQYTDWETALDELSEYYRNTSIQYVKDQISQIIGDGSLANVSSQQRLSSIINSLMSLYQQFEDDHRKSVSLILADAYYRQAKVAQSTGPMSEFFKYLDSAESYASEVRSWYDGKDLLARIHRRRARAYYQRGQRSEALSHINRLFNLDEQYEANLTTDYDDRLRDELTQ